MAPPNPLSPTPPSTRSSTQLSGSASAPRLGRRRTLGALPPGLPPLPPGLPRGGSRLASPRHRTVDAVERAPVPERDTAPCVPSVDVAALAPAPAPPTARSTFLRSIGSAERLRSCARSSASAAAGSLFTAVAQGQRSSGQHHESSSGRSRTRPVPRAPPSIVDHADDDDDGDVLNLLDDEIRLQRRIRDEVATRSMPRSTSFQSTQTRPMQTSNTRNMTRSASFGDLSGAPGATADGEVLRRARQFSI